MSIRFDGRVAVVTGGGSGLGRAHAHGLAERGARVVVCDRGVAADGRGGSGAAAAAVVQEIEARGGEAMAADADVTDMAQVATMVERAMAAYGRIDVLINNAGILRDKSFAKMELADFEAVLKVHVMGAVHCTKAVWDIMRAQNYGRVLVTTSGSGLYGNFGQANYAAAKMALVGLMNALHIEGRKHDIRVNALSPTAATRMTEGLLPRETLALMTPESITPGALYLVSEEAPSRVILCAGAGSFARTLITETEGIHVPEDVRSPEAVAARFADISDPTDEAVLDNAYEQTARLVGKAAAARKVAG